MNQDAEHIIDCNEPPFIPAGWNIEKHYPGGKVKWDKESIRLWYAGNRTRVFFPDGDTYRLSRTVLTSGCALNACVLDYLLVHRNLIPEEWKGEVIAFIGTIYCRDNGDIDFRCLYWDDDESSWMADDISLVITVLFEGVDRPAIPRLKRKAR